MGVQKARSPAARRAALDLVVVVETPCAQLKAFDFCSLRTAAPLVTHASLMPLAFRAFDRVMQRREDEHLLFRDSRKNGWPAVSRDRAARCPAFVKGLQIRFARRYASGFFFPAFSPPFRGGRPESSRVDSGKGMRLREATYCGEQRREFLAKISAATLCHAISRDGQCRQGGSCRPSTAMARAVASYQRHFTSGCIVRQIESTLPPCLQPQNVRS